MANLNTNIPAPRVSFTDPRTGLMSREWYLFLLDLFSTVNVLPSSDDFEAFEIVPVQESAQLFAAVSDLLANPTNETAELALYQLRQEVSLYPSRVPLKIEDLNGFVSTSTSLTENSNLKLATQRAIKTYVDNTGGGLSRGKIIDLPNLPVFL